MARHTSIICSDLDCKRKAVLLILDCEGGSPVCIEHAKLEHIQGSDGEPYQTSSIPKNWKGPDVWLEDYIGNGESLHG